MICNNLESTVNEYLTHLERKRRVTSKTLKNYRSTCTAFVQWANDAGHTLDSDALQDFVSRYDHAASANVHLVRLVGLAKFAKVPVEVVRAKEEIREVEALTSEELARLVRAAYEVDDDTGNSAVFLSETGLRFEEFMQASTENVRHSSGNVYLEVFGKGRKHRKVPLTMAARNALKALPQRTSGFERSLRPKLTKAGKRARIATHVHPHLLRASFISIHLNEKGTQALHVAQIVGHSSVDTMLKHYAQVSMAALSRAMECG